MKKALAALFLTPKRRVLTATISLLTIAVFSWLTVYYLDELCDHPSLALLTVVCWLALIIACWWLALMAMSPKLTVPSFLKEWMEDALIEHSVFRANSDQSRAEELTDLGFKLEALDPMDPRQFQVNAESRFRFYFFSGILACLLLTHFTQDAFLTRFQKVGLTLTYLRSNESLTRLKGLNLLIDLGRHRLVSQNQFGEESVAKSLERALLALLDDPHEGVRARSAFVCGNLHLKTAVPKLVQMVREDEVLREVALLALGAMPVTPITPHPAHLALKELAKNNALVHEQALAFAIATGRQRVNVGQQLQALYQAHSLPNKVHEKASTKIREAIIWAFGELRNSDYLEILSQALKDPELSVRCLAALSFEKLVLFESSPILREAFENSKKDEQCLQVIAPTQEGVKALVLMDKKSYQLALMRALATTDDPKLLQWMVDHQEGIDPMANRLMYKYYKALEKKEKSGLLDALKRKNQN